MLFLLWQLISVLSSLTTEDVIFFSLILFRYLRTVVHFITGVFLYRLALVNDKPRYLSHNAAIIIPTVDPNTNEFLRCCDTVLANGPGVLVVVTVGIKLEQDVRKLIKDHDYESRFPVVKFFVTYTDEANKRRQVARGSDFLDADETPVTICVDDHVYWGPQFLRTLMPAFDDPKVGLVGTNKKVIRDTHGGLWHSFTNFIACLYLVRHNFQIRSEPYVDGGIFVVSGRTSAIRTEILQTEYCKNGYQNEMYLFGLLGPLNPDDDNCITRWVLRNGWKVRIQYSEECKIVTPLGEPHKFYGQSNMASLRMLHTWRHFPWSVYAIYISQMINFAVFWDPLLVWSLTRTSFYTASADKSLFIGLMIGWILLSKMIKIAPHFYDHPSDLLWLPTYFAFAYWHSFVKLYCALTFWEHSWNGRNLEFTQVGPDQLLGEVGLMRAMPDSPRVLRGTNGAGVHPAASNHPYRRCSASKEGGAHQ